MVETSETDFDSDCSTPTRYVLDRLPLPRSITTDETFFSTVHSQSLHGKNIHQSIASAESMALTSIDSSSSVDDSRDDAQKNKIILKREPSRDGSSVFYDACDNLSSEGRYDRREGSQVSTFFSCNEVPFQHFDHQMIKITHPSQLMQQIDYEEKDFSIMNQSYNEYCHMEVGYASDNICRPIRHIYYSHGSDMSDIYSPTGAETILGPNSFDISSIWKKLQTLHNSKNNWMTFCSWIKSCQSPYTQPNVKNVYNEEVSFEQYLSTSYHEDTSMHRDKYSDIEGLKTQKRKNTLPSSLTGNRNFYIVDETRTDKNGERDVYRTSLSPTFLQSNDCYYNGYDGMKDYYTYISPVKDFNIEKHLSAKRLHSNEVYNIEGVRRLTFKESFDDECRDVLFVRSSNTIPCTTINDQDMISMESNEVREILSYFLLRPYNTII